MSAPLVQVSTATDEAAITVPPPVIGLRGVGQTFHDPKQGRRVRVLGGVNLDVHAGEIICVVGPSGCGKSTLLNGIGGFRPFIEGDARLDGQPIAGPGKDRGAVFQDYPVPEFLSALDNVALGLNLDRLPFWQNLLPAALFPRRREHLAEAAGYLAQVGLTEHAHKFPHELSGGQRQRVAIAQALAMKPRVLLMDEPFSGLDPRSRENLQLTVLRIHEQLGNTIFFVTHDLEEAVFIGDRVIVLSQFGGADAAREGATIVHDRNLAAYKDPEVKKTPEFASLMRELRATFGDARFSPPDTAASQAPAALLVKSK